MRAIPDWRRQAIVRALVMGEMNISEIASECGVDPWTVRKVRREMQEADACKPECRRLSAKTA